MFKYFVNLRQTNFLRNLTLQKSNFFNVNKIFFSKLTNSASENDEDLEDEIALINQLITNPHTVKTKHTTDKPGFKLDVMKDLKKYHESKNMRSKLKDDEEKTENFIRNKLKKMSEAEQSTIRADEDVSKYSIFIQSEKDTETILDSVFKKGINEKFYEKLDLIYDKVKDEEIEEWEKLGKSQNLYNEVKEDKDLSDLEQEVEKMFVEKMNEDNKKIKVKTIEEYLGQTEIRKSKASENMKVNENQSHSLFKTAQKKPVDFIFNKVENKNSVNITKDKGLNIAEGKNEININFADMLNPVKNEVPSNINIIKTSSNDYYNDSTTTLSLNQVKVKKTAIKTQNKAKPEIKAQAKPEIEALDKVEIEALAKPEIKAKAKPEIEAIEKQKIKAKAKTETKAHPNKPISPPMKKLPFVEQQVKLTKTFKPSLEYFKSLGIPTSKETFTQSTCLNLQYETLFNLFETISYHLYDKTEFVNKKTNRVSYFKSLKNNIQQFLVENYQIKTFGDKFSIRLFKTVLLDIDRRRFEIITSRILNSHASHINIIINAKRSAVTKEGYAVFMIYAEEEFVGSILVNFGVIQNVNLCNYLSSFISLVIVELIQACTQKNKRLLQFNMVFAKKFDLESKLTVTTKTPLILILNNLIEGKLSKFKRNDDRLQVKKKENNFNTDLDEFLDEVGNTKSVEKIKSHVPNLKFYSYTTLFKKYFTQFFLASAKLEGGSLCFKF